MGGASSLLEETDWEKADGKINSTLDTVDGAPPTENFALFYITKKGFNQREFDVTDSNNNLLYTTRQVPGTVCSFDVLGKEIGSYKLRVHSDLARRYWIVYRFGSQSFDDQELDREESEKAEQQFAGIDVPVERPIQLYKRLCVTVSWSRYLAVAAFFGPPTIEMLAEYSKREKEKADKLSEVGDSSHGASGDVDFALREETTTTNVNDDVPHQQNGEHREDQGATTDNYLDNASSHSSSASNYTSQHIVSSINVQHWIQKHSKSFREKSRKVLHGTLAAKHPAEGVLDLDKPLILCQEIFTRLIGNHQTSRISKERVLSLLQQDMAQHLQSTWTEEETSSAGAPMMMTEGHLLQQGEDCSPGDGIEESKSAALDNEESSSDQPREAVSDKEEPLVAYWKWEHSFQTQKMKMHLAKNSDLALHVVVAIIANQVRYERNAIAMTM